MSVFDAFRRIFSPTPAVTAPVDWLIVGLGNPGADYALTRHNVGYLGLDKLLAGRKLERLSGMPALATFIEPSALLPEVASEQTQQHGRLMLLRSTTYMNLSGEAVGAAAATWQVPAERIIVLHDELDLPEGTVRLKKGGNENGHNGLKSISEHLGTRDYVRVRLGIGRPPKDVPVPDYVLGPLGPHYEAMIDLAAQAALLITTEGLVKTQNTIHARPASTT